MCRSKLMTVLFRMANEAGYYGPNVNTVNASMANLDGTTNLRRDQNGSTIDINNDGETIRVNFKKKMNSAYYTVLPNNTGR